MELAQPLSREGTPTGDQTVVDNDAKQEEPDASATPPPPVSQSPEPTTDVEPLESYIESGNFKKMTDNRYILIEPLISKQNENFSGHSWEVIAFEN